MTLRELAGVLGEPPAPEGTWEREALLVSAAALRRRLRPEALAARVREVPGVTRVAVRATGLLEVAVRVPGELLESFEVPEIPVPGWPDFPRTWDNPGFVVRYGHVRARAVARWARQLGVPEEGFEAAALDGPWDRRVLRVLAELPGRAAGRAPGWEAYLVRLALAYHDAHEHAPAVPRGDEPARAVHTARVRLAAAVGEVLAGPERL
ncbi:anticodon-binding protein [Nonomuraea sp. NPDC050783]|uniref:anticodon-binding protein n=1 Tax=Nonomuraea sp. NPDC050783 TaxID=3154634 RepID=UPI0034674B28